MSQRTLGLLKPDGGKRGLAGAITSRIEPTARRPLPAVELRTFDRARPEQHYAAHVGRPFAEPLLAF
ncbi:nucleoside-diphosphate kinase, partial [Saccharothrix sp. ST-888]|uniref:nucleoside-diphosphate kinase n=1 Tax=Saccharothrix sp. ST-888 TaxID=1427391 RepID=UPI0005EC4A3E